MGPVKNTKLQVTLERVAGMSKDKRDVIGVKFTLNGRVCGVHVVVIC